MSLTNKIFLYYTVTYLCEGEKIPKTNYKLHNALNWDTIFEGSRERMIDRFLDLFLDKENEVNRFFLYNSLNKEYENLPHLVLDKNELIIKSIAFRTNGKGNEILDIQKILMKKLNRRLISKVLNMTG